MFIRCVLAALAAVSAGYSARAADLAAIPRVIRKEPAYQGKPRYCLLVFGKEASTHVWMVQDGGKLYVDRNGNGDLTEPGEQINGNGSYYDVNDIVEGNGTRHQRLFVMCRNDGSFELHLDGGGRRQYVGMELMERPRWADKAEDAPIIHFNGPMSLERYGPVYKLPRNNGQSRSIRYSLRLMLGTPGLGKGTFASYDEICSEKLGPIEADVVFPAPTPLDEPVRLRMRLDHDG